MLFFIPFFSCYSRAVCFGVDLHAAFDQMQALYASVCAAARSALFPLRPAAERELRSIEYLCTAESASLSFLFERSLKTVSFELRTLF